METDPAGMLVEFSKGFRNLQNNCFVNLDSEHDMHLHDRVLEIWDEICHRFQSSLLVFDFSSEH